MKVKMIFYLIKPAVTAAQETKKNALQLKKTFLERPFQL